MNRPAHQPFGRELSLGAPCLKSPEEIDAIARAGVIARAALACAGARCRPGVSTAEIASAAAAEITRRGGEAIFLGYRQGGAPPFPGAACVSVNDEVVHGVPGARVVEPGDLVSIDVGVRFDGWCADTATTMLVAGMPSAPEPPRAVGRSVELLERRRLIVATRALLERAVSLMRPGERWSRIAAVLEESACASGFGLVTEFVGHGVGRELHEAPKAPAYWTGFRGEDFELAPGLVLAVEPILCLRTIGPTLPPADPARPWRVPVRAGPDGWTTLTANGWPTAHEEHTVAVTDTGRRVLTPGPGLD